MSGLKQVKQLLRLVLMGDLIARYMLHYKEKKTALFVHDKEIGLEAQTYFLVMNEK